jgi:hypothetical protein
MDLEEITQHSQKMDECISSKVIEGARKLRAKVDHLSENATASNSKSKEGAQQHSASVKRNPRDQKTSSIAKLK